MRYLVTRPEPGATEFAAGLARRGAEAVMAPLFSIRFADGPPLDLAGIDALVVTSANAVAALVRRCDTRALPLFAIGPQTAATARSAGFVRVENADGDRTVLGEVLARAMGGGTLLHACGVEAPDLAAAGCVVRRAVLYESVAATALPAAAASALRDGTLAGAFFFSPRGAEVFARLVLAERLDRYCAALDAYCISAPAAKFPAPLSFAHIFIASRPNRAAMLDMLPKEPSS